jgi:hypothetical protein
MENQLKSANILNGINLFLEDDRNMCIFKRTILRICIEAGLQSFYAKQVMIKMIMEETHNSNKRNYT